MRNESGQILITAMILTIVIAFSFIATMNYVMNSQLNAESQAADEDYLALVGQIGTLMQREDSCRASFGGAPDVLVNPNGTVAWMPQTFPALAAGTAIPVNMYYPAPGTFIGTGNPALTKFIGTVGGGASTFGRLSNISLTMTLGGIASTTVSPPTTAYGATLQVTATKPSGLGGAGNLSLPTPISLVVRLNALSQIISCTTQFFGTPAAPILIPSCGPAQGLYYSPTIPAGPKLVCIKVVCYPPTPNFINWQPHGSATEGNIVCGP
jgi:hypothetical protein